MKKTVIIISSVILGLMLFIIIGAFYWLQIRPSAIRAKCAEESVFLYDKRMMNEKAYNTCLVKNGLEK